MGGKAVGGNGLGGQKASPRGLSRRGPPGLALQLGPLLPVVESGHAVAHVPGTAAGGRQQVGPRGPAPPGRATAAPGPGPRGQGRPGEPRSARPQSHCADFVLSTAGSRPPSGHRPPPCPPNHLPPSPAALWALKPHSPEPASPWSSAAPKSKSPLSPSPAGLCTFRVFLLLLLVRWGQKTLFPVSGAVSQQLCLGEAEWGCSGLPFFPVSPVGKGLQLLSGYELILLSVCVAWEASVPVSASREQSSLLTCLLASVPLSYFWSEGARRHSLQWTGL